MAQGFRRGGSDIPSATSDSYNLQPNASRETHVWVLDLEVGADRLAQLERLLAGDEQERAWRFRVAVDRARFVAARGMLRQILGRYLGRDPRSIQFIQSPFGKPGLASQYASVGLRFNATRSERLALVAVRQNAELGIDVERLRPIPDADALLERLLTPDERSVFANLREAALQQRFFETWVRKEAVTKMLGIGLRQPLAELSMHTWHARGPGRLDLPPWLSARPVWLLPLEVPMSGFVAALATDAPIGAVKLAEWAPDQATSSAT